MIEEENAQTTFRVCTDKAVILNVPIKKTIIGVAGRADFSRLFSCFFDVVDCLIQQSSKIESEQLLLCTRRVRVKIQALFVQYASCEHTFHLITEAAKKREWPADSFMKKAVDIHYPSLEKVLKQNLIKNMQKNVGDDYSVIHQTELCEKYMSSFIEYYRKEDSLPKRTPVEWMGLAAKYLPNMWYTILEEASFDLLKEVNVSETEKVNHPFLLLQRKWANRCGFEESAEWVPGKNFNEFMDCLKIHGYLVVGGFFGKGYYNQSAVAKKIGDIETLSWPKGSFEAEKYIKKISIGHEVVVIGASCVGYENVQQDLIYFVDPWGDRNAESYPIYIMSYENFCMRLGTTCGQISLSWLEQKKLEIPKFNYFYYHPALKPVCQNTAPAILAEKGSLKEQNEEGNTEAFPHLEEGSQSAFYSGHSFWSINCNTVIKIAIVGGVAAAAIGYGLR
jgi:hypothetical protein